MSRLYGLAREYELRAGYLPIIEDGSKVLGAKGCTSTIVLDADFVDFLIGKLTRAELSEERVRARLRTLRGQAND